MPTGSIISVQQLNEALIHEYINNKIIILFNDLLQSAKNNKASHTQESKSCTLRGDKLWVFTVN